MLSIVDKLSVEVGQVRLAAWSRRNDILIDLNSSDEWFPIRLRYLEASCPMLVRKLETVAEEKTAAVVGMDDLVDMNG